VLPHHARREVTDRSLQREVDEAEFEARARHASLDLADDGFGLFAIAAGQDYLRAEGREATRHFLSDARAGARHEHGLPAQLGGDRRHARRF
jgi:hypothetical protein